MKITLEMNFEDIYRLANTQVKIVLNVLLTYTDRKGVEKMLEDFWYDYKTPPTYTEIHDFLWFDTETIAEYFEEKDFETMFNKWCKDQANENKL